MSHSKLVCFGLAVVVCGAFAASAALAAPATLSASVAAAAVASAAAAAAASSSGVAMVIVPPLVFQVPSETLPLSPSASPAVTQ